MRNTKMYSYEIEGFCQNKTKAIELKKNRANPMRMFFPKFGNEEKLEITLKMKKYGFRKERHSRH